MIDQSFMNATLARIEGKLDAHLERHLSDTALSSAHRIETEARLTKLETVSRPLWAIVAALLGAGLSAVVSIFGPHLTKGTP